MFINSHAYLIFKMSLLNLSPLRLAQNSDTEQPIVNVYPKLSPSTTHHQSSLVSMAMTPSDRPPPLSTTFENLTSLQVQSVETFLFFIGYGRSGHSLVASILDAHPNVIIAHEYYLFDKLNQPRRYPMLTNKSGLFDELYLSSYTSAAKGWRAAVNTSKGYNFELPGTWQGRFNQLKVIGDKTGGATAMMYHKDPNKFKNTYRSLQQTVDVPIKTLHVVRNPFDMIATVALYHASGHPDSLKVPASVENKFNDITFLSQAVSIILNKADAVFKMPDDAGLSVMEIHLEDLIKDPKGILKRVCEYLEVQCTEEYLTTCVGKVYTTISKSREVVVWPKVLVDRVVQATKTYSFFNRYSFEGS